jgi:hypothetical protein
MMSPARILVTNVGLSLVGFLFLESSEPGAFLDHTVNERYERGEIHGDSVHLENSFLRYTIRHVEAT